MTDTPQWALDKAAKAAGSTSWRLLNANHGMNGNTWKSVQAHAATIAKYEKPPVDPDLERARELLDDVDTFPHSDVVCRDETIKAIMAALKEGRK